MREQEHAAAAGGGGGPPPVQSPPPPHRMKLSGDADALAKGLADLADPTALKVLMLAAEPRTPLPPVELGRCAHLEMLAWDGGCADVLVVPPCESVQMLRLFNVDNLGARSLHVTPGRAGQLEELTLKHNKLASLPEELGALPLRKLNVEANCIRAIPRALRRLTRLEVASFCGNRLTAMYDAPGQNDEDGPNFPALKELDVACNLITHFADSDLRGMASIESMDLSFNYARTLPRPVGTLTTVKVLDVGSNLLTTLPSELERLERLEDAMLGHNSLSSVPAPILASVKNLTLFGSALTRFPRHLSDLEGIQLLGNRLDHLEVEDIRACAGTLRDLWLGCNHISHISAGVLSAAPRLQVLWLGGNALSELPDDIKALRELRILGLIDNLLSSLPTGLGWHMPNLAQLLVQSNCMRKIACTGDHEPGARWYPMLEDLSVYGNDESFVLDAPEGIALPSLRKAACEDACAASLRTLARSAEKLKFLHVGRTLRELPFGSLLRTPSDGGVAQTLLVIFNSITSLEFSGALHRTKAYESCAVLWLDDTRSMFSRNKLYEPCMEEFVQAFKRVGEGRQNVVFIGSSMSAMSALMYGTLAHKVLAYSPGLRAISRCAVDQSVVLSRVRETVRDPSVEVHVHVGKRNQVDLALAASLFGSGAGHVADYDASSESARASSFRARLVLHESCDHGVNMLGKPDIDTTLRALLPGG